jgi:hypothetical protein
MVAVFGTFFPNWLGKSVVTFLALFVTLMLAGVFLLAVRKLWWKWQSGKWYGDLGRTMWRMLPLEELPAADSRTGIPTDAILDALARLGRELEREIWQPKLLLLSMIGAWLLAAGLRNGPKVRFEEVASSPRSRLVG